eukprot:TRINITY_DN14664_c0_g1_i2.p1 TRINITY_DN14664_c0_g1~~TRINITY_DN14664_c0_g1_i2.p1  ORF type:complete len:117 (+),score=26.24 TRINITY_DN14664_c0_g1_i2:55-405(+)
MSGSRSEDVPELLVNNASVADNDSDHATPRRENSVHVDYSSMTKSPSQKKKEEQEWLADAHVSQVFNVVLQDILKNMPDHPEEFFWSDLTKYETLEKAEKNVSDGGPQRVPQARGG